MDPLQQATRIIAIRHGETAWNAEGRIQGHLDIELNGMGRWQASRVAAALAGEDIAVIYTSDLQRAHATAQAITTATGAPLIAEPGLRERGFGKFEGCVFSEIERDAPEDARRWSAREPDYLPEGGESLLMVRARIERVVNRIAAQHIGQAIVLVAHGGVLDVLYRLATRVDVQSPRTWLLANAAINRLLWTPQGMTLVGWGDMQHLEGEAQDERHS